MTLKEFLEKNPEAIKEASKCKNVAEFKKLTESVGITFETEEKLNKAFELVKNQTVTELTDDALDAVSGGRGRVYQASEVAITPDGRMWTEGTGNKA